MKILLISTGGTIASKPGEDGLAPVEQGEALAAQVPGISEIADIEIFNVFSKDSSNMHPDDWLAIIKALYLNREKFDGFIITHGTDTMAYTSSALSFVLRDFDKPVILTGSMLPMSYEETDAKYNLENSFKFMRALLDRGQNGVSICFAAKLIHGPRAKKISAKKIDAFNSVFYDDLGRLENGKAVIAKKPFIDRATLCSSSKNKSAVRFANDIMPVKIFPGFRAHYFDRMVDLKPAAIVAECFGLGGFPFMGENLLSGIKRATSLGILTVITTQCPEGGVDLATYDVGQKSLKSGAVSGFDMGFEAIITKLMYLLPLMPADQAGEMLSHNFCDEVGKVEI